MCCGADALGGDPLGGLNLSPAGLADCVRHVSERSIAQGGLPLLLLGGGG